MTRKTSLLGALLVWALLGSTATAHELEANRLTLVLRDRNHITLSFHINLGDALHRTLAPQRPFQEFVLVYSAMSPQEFQAEWVRAKTKFQKNTRLTFDNGREASLTHWDLPEAPKVQALLQQHAMQGLVAQREHSHISPTEIRAEVAAQEPIASATVRLPDEWQPTLLVWYRPSQTWLRPASPSAQVSF